MEGLSTPVGKNRTFSHYADRWLESVAFRLKDTSLAKYQHLIVKYLNPKFGDLPVDSITLVAVQLFVSELAAPTNKARNLSASTVKMILSTCRRILDFARSELSLPNLDFQKLLPIAGARNKVDVLTKDEMKRLHRYLMAHYRQNLALVGVYLSLVTGMRIGEICALQWRNVDLTKNTITVVHTLTRVQTFKKRGPKTKLRLSSPKTRSSSRIVPLSRKTRSLLASIRVDEPDAFLLSGNASVVEPRALEYLFRRVLDECGLRRIRFHALRHTFATQFLAMGLDVKELAEGLGHSSIRTTLDVYYHTSLDSKIQNLDKLDQNLYG